MSIKKRPRTLIWSQLCSPSRRFLAQQVQRWLIGSLSRSDEVTRKNLREGCDTIPFIGGLGITLGSSVANHDNRTAMTTRHVIGAKSRSEVRPAQEEKRILCGSTPHHERRLPRRKPARSGKQQAGCSKQAPLGGCSTIVGADQCVCPSTPTAHERPLCAFM